MARSLAERIEAARGTQARIADVEALIVECKSERARLIDARDKASGDSIDFGLSEADRDEAAVKSGRYDRTAAGLEKVIEELTALAVAKREHEQQRSEETGKAAALAERDALAERFRVIVPEAIAALTDLFAAIEANAAKLVWHKLYVRDAEAEARDAPGNWRLPSGAIVDRFLQLKIPSFDPLASDRAWPRPVAQIDPGEIVRTQRIAAQARQDAEEARWDRYAVTAPPDATDPVTVAHRRGPLRIGTSPKIAVLTAEGAELARDAGCTVTLVPAGKHIGMPVAGTI